MLVFNFYLQHYYTLQRQHNTCDFLFNTNIELVHRFNSMFQLQLVFGWAENKLKLKSYLFPLLSFGLKLIKSYNFLTLDGVRPLFNLEQFN